MLKFTFPFLLLTLLNNNAESSRILAVIPTPSYSHQVFYYQLWRELSIRGHDLVIITTDPMYENLPNVREININESYVQMKKMVDYMVTTNFFKLMFEDSAQALILEYFDNQVNLPQMQEFIKNKSEHFDLIIMEQVASPLLGFKYQFNCPMIGVTSMDGLYPAHEIMGNPTHSILYPQLTSSLGAYPTFLERLVAVVSSKLTELYVYRTIKTSDVYAKEAFGQDLPSVDQILETMDMLFVNANPIFNAVRPLTPSTISIAGGIHMKPEKPLPKDIKVFLDNSKQGVIYFSLGSNVKSNELSLELRQTFLETLSQLPYNILWKFEDDNLPDKPKNVMISKWAPQQDILRHKNIKLFITQAGLQSLEEALYLHVPVVMIPFFGDQEGNARRASEKKIGVAIDRHTITVDNFKTAILEVVNNPIYKDTVKRLATEIQDTPMTSLNRAIWWIEYVIRHKGAQHLKGPKIPLYQYYYLDVLALLGVGLFVILGLIFGIIRFCLMRVCRLVKGVDKVTLKQKIH